MQIIQWQQSHRRITQSGMRNVFGGGLAAPLLFRFKTQNLYVPPHTGAYSIKMVLSGEERYQVGDRQIILRPGDYLTLEDGVYYASDISSETESLSLFLPKSPELNRLAGQFNASLSANKAKLSEKARQSLNDLLAAIQNNQQNAATQAVQKLVAKTHSDFLQTGCRRKMLEGIVKNSTRNAILHRLNRAKSKIDSSTRWHVPLDDLAREACLSTYHFSRLFHEVFGISPAAYVRQRSLFKAAYSLSTGESLSNIASRTGYRDQRAFRRALIRQFGQKLFENTQDETRAG